MSPPTEALDRMIAGELTIEQVAQQFGAMSWPAPADPPRTLEQVEADPDPEPAEPGSFAEVAAYYMDGRITPEQYATLAGAAAVSKIS